MRITDHNLTSKPIMPVRISTPSCLSRDNIKPIMHNSLTKDRTCK